MNITIQETLCRRCGRCASVCPSEVFHYAERQVPQIQHPEGCIACGHCLDVCPAWAIRHEAIPLERVHEIDYYNRATPLALMQLIKVRRSNRTLTDKPIPEQMLADILEAARYAPTAENTRKVQLTLIQDPAALQAIEDTTMRFFLKLSGVLMNPVVRPLTRLVLPSLYAEAPELDRFQRRWQQGQRPCSCNAKAMLVFSTPRGYDFGAQDANLAYQNASLMAESYGVSQIYMGLILTAFKFLPRKRVVRLLGLPKDHLPQALMALGMPAFPFLRYTER